MILRIIALIVILIGVIFVYDARILSSRWFGFSDLNQATNRNKNWWIFLGNYWGINNTISMIFLEYKKIRLAILRKNWYNIK